MTHDEIIREAAALGKREFEAGRVRNPTRCNDLHDMLFCREEVASATIQAARTAFTDAWDATNLATPVPCCCFGHAEHDGACCDGYFFNEETNEVERCDDCKKFADDDAATVAHDTAITLAYFEDSSWESTHTDMAETMTLHAFLARNPALSASDVAAMRQLVIGGRFYFNDEDEMIRRLA